MLLAEIHGKRSKAIEGSEDYLTSTVFGQLRFVSDGAFWRSLFQKAKSTESRAMSLMAELESSGAKIEDTCNLKILFWPNTVYGEPDLLLHFQSKFGRPVIILMEIKLYSEKSSVGPNDQLSRYFKLLHDPLALAALLGQDSVDAEVGLIYLTERFAAAEVSESIRLSDYEDAERRMFPMQWQDMTEVLREMRAPKESLLGEILTFLLGRQLEHFQGFHDLASSVVFGSGHFYSSTYFNKIPLFLDQAKDLVEGFYAE